MQYEILHSIKHLKLENDLYNTPLFDITSNPLKKSKFLNLDFRELVGERTFRSYNKNVLGVKDSNDDKMTENFVSNARQMETFLLFLWFVKDNSVSLEESYLRLPKAKSFSYFTSRLNSSMSNGEFLDIEFSNSEVKAAIKLLSKYTEISQVENDSIEDYDFGDQAMDSKFNANFKKNPKENKIERAMIFLNTARSTPYVPQKITHYMSILECLFSSDANEVNHKVSERTAHYIGKDKVEKIEIFKKVKAAYDIRSKFVHGQKLKLTYEKMAEQSKSIDDLLRLVLTKIITSDSVLFTGKEDELNKYLSDIIF